jgi:hypothetical protein
MRKIFEEFVADVEAAFDPVKGVDPQIDLGALCWSDLYTTYLEAKAALQTPTLSLKPEALEDIRQMLEFSEDAEDGDGFWTGVQLLLEFYDAHHN